MNPFASDYNFLIGALSFEEIGVSAYTGAAHLISATAVLDAAAGIQAAEAYHAGSIRTILAGNALASGSAAYLTAYNSILQLFNKLDPTSQHHAADRGQRDHRVDRRFGEQQRDRLRTPPQTRCCTLPTARFQAPTLLPAASSQAA